MYVGVVLFLIKKTTNKWRHKIKKNMGTYHLWFYPCTSYLWYFWDNRKPSYLFNFIFSKYDLSLYHLLPFPKRYYTPSFSSIKLPPHNCNLLYIKCEQTTPTILTKHIENKICILIDLWIMHLFILFPHQYPHLYCYHIQTTSHKFYYIHPLKSSFSYVNNNGEPNWFPTSISPWASS